MTVRRRIYNEAAFAEASDALFELIDKYREHDDAHREELEERVRAEAELPREKGGLR